MWFEKKNSFLLDLRIEEKTICKDYDGYRLLRQENHFFLLFILKMNMKRKRNFVGFKKSKIKYFYQSVRITKKIMNKK